MKVKNSWLTEIKKCLQNIGVLEATALDRFRFRTLIYSHQFIDKSVTGSNKTWAEERKNVKRFHDSEKYFAH